MLLNELSAKMGMFIYAVAFASILGGIIAYFAFLTYRLYFSYFRKLLNIPTLKGHIILGNLEQISGPLFAKRDIPLYKYVIEAGSYYLEILRKHRVVVLWLTWIPYIAVLHPEATEAVLSSTNVLRKSSEYTYFEPWIGTGLLTSTAQKWKSRRKMLTPTFHFKILEDFQSIFDKHSQELAKKISESSSNVINVFKYIPMATLDVICETAMGVCLNAQNDPSSDYIKAVTFTSESIFNRILDLKYWYDPIFYRTALGKQYRHSIDLMHKFSLEVINKKRVEMENARKLGAKKPEQEDDYAFSGSRRKKVAFMDLLLENYFDSMKPDGTTDFTIEDIREEVDTFMFEGFETTGTAVAFTLYLLGLHEEYQEKAYNEILDVFGHDKERPVTTDDLKRLKYLECCVKESLRLFPSVPLIARRTTEEINILGYQIPKNITILIYIYGLHRDSEIYPNPEEFDPSRFFPENCADRHPYAYIPFSAGPRNCIGQRFALMEVKTMVANMLRHFQLRSLKGRDKIDVCIEIIIKSKAPLEVTFTPRSG